MFVLPQLPYDLDALEPHMSKKTLEFHYGKHHSAYFANLNKLLPGSQWEKLEPTIANLEKITQESYKKNDGIFNNAAQAWNHILFWNGMKSKGGGKPTGVLLSKIEKSFGSFDKFKEDFKNAAVGQFGSGWAWLALEDETLKVMKTPNGENPLVHGMKPLLGLDVWEHSYYLDYQNRRPDYVDTFLEHLVNWDYVESRLLGK